MPESCPSCGRTIPEGASFCPWCGVAPGSRGLTFWQYYKGLISRISPATPREIGDIHRAETELRVKLATVSWWKTWSQLANGLIKALPTVIIANAVLLIVTVKTVSIADEAYDSLVMVPGYTLGVFGALFTLSLWATRRIDVRLTKFSRQAMNQEAEVKALRKMAITKFIDYRDRMMPYIYTDQPRSDFIQPKGKIVRRFLVSNWRDEERTPRERQLDMNDIDHSLVVRMDGLVTLANAFCDEFDRFGEECRSELSKVVALQGQAATLSYPIAVQALYRYFSKDIQNENDLPWAQQMSIIDSQGMDFLRKFFRGNPLDPKDFASLSSRTALFELAKKAKEAQVAARRPFEKVKIDLEAKTFLE